MKEIMEVLNKHKETIIQKATDWGFKNVRIYESNAPAYQNALNLLVDLDGAEMVDVELLRLDLETFLGCSVNVTNKDLLGDFLFNQLKNKAIPIEDYAAIFQRFNAVSHKIKPPTAYQTEPEKNQLIEDLVFIQNSMLKVK